MYKQKIRYPKLDILRGLCLVSMIAYHTVWDLVNIYDFNWMWYRSVLSRVWQQSICWTFILLAGFCLPMGRHHIRRGAIVFGAGALITVVTLIVMPDQPIIFGVLTFIGSCVILVGLIDSLLKKIMTPVLSVAGIIISFMLFSFTYSVNYRAVGVFGEELIRLSGRLYDNYFTTFLGFPPAGFASTDYFSLVPWIFLFMTGYFLHFAVMKSRKNVCGTDGSEQGRSEVVNSEREGVSRWLQRGKCTPLEWMGRHSLLVYLVHQVVIYCLLWVVFKIL